MYNLKCLHGDLLAESRGVKLKNNARRSSNSLNQNVNEIQKRKKYPRSPRNIRNKLEINPVDTSTPPTGSICPFPDFLLENINPLHESLHDDQREVKPISNFLDQSVETSDKNVATKMAEDRMITSLLVNLQNSRNLDDPVSEDEETLCGSNEEDPKDMSYEAEDPLQTMMDDLEALIAEDELNLRNKERPIPTLKSRRLERPSSLTLITPLSNLVSSVNKDTESHSYALPTDADNTNYAKNTLIGTAKMDKDLNCPSSGLDSKNTHLDELDELRYFNNANPKRSELPKDFQNIDVDCEKCIEDYISNTCDFGFKHKLNLVMAKPTFSVIVSDDNYFARFGIINYVEGSVEAHGLVHDMNSELDASVIRYADLKERAIRKSNRTSLFFDLTIPTESIKGRIRITLSNNSCQVSQDLIDYVMSIKKRRFFYNLPMTDNFDFRRIKNDMVCKSNIPSIHVFLDRDYLLHPDFQFVMCSMQNLLEEEQSKNWIIVGQLDINSNDTNLQEILSSTNLNSCVIESSGVIYPDA